MHLQIHAIAARPTTPMKTKPAMTPRTMPMMEPTLTPPLLDLSMLQVESLQSSQEHAQFPGCVVHWSYSYPGLYSPV